MGVGQGQRSFCRHSRGCGVDAEPNSNLLRLLFKGFTFQFCKLVNASVHHPSELLRGPKLKGYTRMPSPRALNRAIFG
jgi:hypothetical protein